MEESGIKNKDFGEEVKQNAYHRFDVI